VDLDALLRIDAVLLGARCWGVELDPRYRVLGVTVEPRPDRHGDLGGDEGLLQLVLQALRPQAQWLLVLETSLVMPKTLRQA